MRSSRLRKKAGFTLVDLLIVILILGIVGMAVSPQFHTMAAASKLNEATAELVDGLHYARNLAIQYQRPFGLYADVHLNTFTVFDLQHRWDFSPHHDCEPPVAPFGVVLNPVDKTWYVKHLSSLHDGVSIDSVPAGGGYITFYPDGHSNFSDSTFVLGLGAEQRTITVSGTTGRVSVN